MKTVRLAVLLVAALAACNGKDTETRAREAAEAIKRQMGDPQAVALEQKVTPETVKQVQEQLQVLHEYLGEVNGVLDNVTVNAIQAFQTSRGVRADGILTDKTKRLLKQAAEQKKAAANAGGKTG